MNKSEIRIFYCDTLNPEYFLGPRRKKPTIPYYCEINQSLKAIKNNSKIYKILIK